MTGPQGRILGLLIGTTWLTLDLIRASGPLVSHLFDSGAVVVAVAAFGPYVCGGVLAYLATLLGRRIGHGQAALSVAGLTVALRLALPLASGAVLVAIGLAALASALCLVLLAIRGAVAVGGGSAAVAACGIGGCVAILEQAILRTWDAAWRTDVLGWTASLLITLVVLGGAWRARQMASEKPVRGLWAVAIWFSLLALAFANLAYVSSQAGIHLAPAIVLAVVGLAGGVVLSSLRPNGGGIATAAVGVVALGATYCFVVLGGLVAVAAIPIAAFSLTYLASRTLTAGANASPSHLRVLGSGVAFGLAILLPYLAVQLDYEIPLGFPHLLVIVVASAALATGGVVRSNHLKTTGMVRALTGSGRRAGLAILAGILIAIPTAMTFNEAAPPLDTLPSDLRVVSWNIHYGVIPGAEGPGVDPKGFAEAIAEQDADVVLLQEVARGWILAGGTDLLQILADELGMNYVYLGTHDRQFGNAILSRYEILDPVSIPLPYGAGPQRRAAIAATIQTSRGAVRVVSVHLQNKDDEATRVAQAEALIAGLPEDGLPIVVGGDFNDTPESTTVATMLDAGFGSAQGVASRPADTYLGGDFHARLDYVFVRDVDAISDLALGGSPLSDHLSLSVTVEELPPYLGPE
jgi:endonuclease/exonuclease/phosphatase family metal-dependent hydrolase